MSSFEQLSCSSCENPVDNQPCRYRTCGRCGYYNRGVPGLGCNSETDNSFTYEPTPYFSMIIQTSSPTLRNLRTVLQSKLNLDGDDDDDDYDKESIISTHTNIFEIPSSNAITTSLPVLPTEGLEDSLIIGNKELNTIPKKESNEFINSSIEDLVPISSKSEDTSGSESVCILPSCDDFSPIDIPEEKAVTFSNPLFNSNDDFISSDDDDVNSLFNELLENIKSKNSCDSNLDEPDLLVTPLFDANKDECFDSGGDVDKINDFENGYYDSEGDILYLESLLNDDVFHRDPSIPAMSVASILEGFTDEPLSKRMMSCLIWNLRMMTGRRFCMMLIF
nr:hypothetical protein [Tanacetum cinerariifolium]